MLVQSLSQLCAQKVAQYIHQGLYDKSRYQLDSKSSNAVFSHLTKMTWSRCLLKQVDYKFHLTKVDLKAHPLDRPTVRMLQMHNLKSLSLGSLTGVKDYYQDESGSIDIVCLLKDTLNNVSRKRLQHLDISGKGKFSEGWIAKIGQLLTSLKSLNIAQRQLTGRDFTNLCNNFTNLHILDIGDTGIQNLDGISNLKNLQVLSMRNLEFQTSEDLIDLFKLKNLRVLDIANNIDEDKTIIRRFLKCGLSLPQLRFMDCTGTDLTEETLEKLVNSHANLEQVAAINTDCEYSTDSSVHLLNLGSLASSIKSIKHYIQLKRKPEVIWALEGVYILFCQGKVDAEWNPMELLKTLGHVMEVFKTKSSKKGGSTEIMRLCLSRCFFQVFQKFSKTNSYPEMLFVINQIRTHLPEHLPSEMSIIAELLEKMLEIK